MTLPTEITTVDHISDLYKGKEQNTSVKALREDNGFNDEVEYQVATRSGNVTDDYIVESVVDRAV